MTLVLDKNGQHYEFEPKQREARKIMTHGSRKILSTPDWVEKSISGKKLNRKAVRIQEKTAENIASIENPAIAGNVSNTAKPPVRDPWSIGRHGRSVQSNTAVGYNFSSREQNMPLVDIGARSFN
jgi:hypothetical protein